MRALPEYLLAFVLLLIFGVNGWPVVLALAIHNAGILGRLDSETIENADPTPLRALCAAGAGRRQMAVVALWPTVFGRGLLYVFYRWETCVREATVLGMLGVVSLGYWIDDGYDVIYTAKANRRNESALRRLAVHAFYGLVNWGARQKIPEDAGDFRLLSPRAAAALRQLPERNRFFKGLTSWIGFRQLRVDYEPAPRAYGVTSFSTKRLVGLSSDGLTSFSVAPLRFASLLGLLLALGAFLFGLSILWETWVKGETVPGYPSIIVGMMTIGGVQLLMIGVMGEYIGKILSELKARPIYFVAEHSRRRAEATADDHEQSAAE